MIYSLPPEEAEQVSCAKGSANETSLQTNQTKRHHRRQNQVFLAAVCELLSFNQRMLSPHTIPIIVATTHLKVRYSAVPRIHFLVIFFSFFGYF